MKGVRTASSALYFPYVDVPSSASLWPVLLYWDSLGSLVPASVLSRLGPWTRTLVDAGLVQPVEPRRYLSGNLQAGFIAGFAALLDILPSQTSPTTPVWIHTDKAYDEVWQLLVERDLAQPAQRTARSGWSEEWAAVEGRAGRLYLSYLATVLARLPALDMEPLTDQRRYFESVSGIPSLSTVSVLDGARAAVLRDVLPVPQGPVDVRDLALFKERHRDLLRSFRRDVEHAVLRCATEPLPDLRARIVRAEASDLTDRVEEIRRRLEERRWPTTAGTLCAACAGLPGATAALVSGQPAVAAVAAGAPFVLDFVQAMFNRQASDVPGAAYAVLAQDAFA
jgi:hypothetical protein